MGLLSSLSFINCSLQNTNENSSMTAPWPLRVQCQQQTPPTPKQRFPLSRQTSVTIRSRMLREKKLIIRNGTTRHMAIKQSWWDHEIFHFRHLQLENQSLAGWSKPREWRGGIIYWIWLLRTNISLPLESDQVSELFETDSALWSRSAEDRTQHESNAFIKEIKASQRELASCWQRLAFKYFCRLNQR